MFSKSAAALVALFGLVAANKNNVHQPKPAGPVTPYKKVQRIQMCASYPQYVYPNTGYGAFTFPIFAGACPSGFAVGASIDAQTFQSLPVTGTRIGVLSSVCSANPYGGKQFTYLRESTGGQDNMDQVGQNSCLGPDNCYYPPTVAPQFVDDWVFPVIPQGTSAERVQEIANEWCTANGNNAAYAAQPGPQQTTCYGKLAIKPPATKQNKYPGSQLKYIYNATTVYEFGGSTYKIDTQYGLGGWENPSDELWYLQLMGYSVFEQITCQWVPREITISPGHITSGSGKFEKTPQAYVQDVGVVTGRIVPDRNPVVPIGNPYNPYQNTPIQWASEITVLYGKAHYDWPLL